MKWLLAPSCWQVISALLFEIMLHSHWFAMMPSTIHYFAFKGRCILIFEYIVILVRVVLKAGHFFFPCIRCMEVKNALYLYRTFTSYLSPIIQHCAQVQQCCSLFLSSQGTIGCC